MVKKLITLLNSYTPPEVRSICFGEIVNTFTYTMTTVTKHWFEVGMLLPVSRVINTWLRSNLTWELKGRGGGGGGVVFS